MAMMMPQSRLLRRPYGPRPIPPYRSAGAAVPVRIGRQVELIDRRLLHAYLPNLTTTHRSHNGVVDLNTLLHTLRPSRIQPALLKDTLTYLLDSLARHPQDIHTTNLDLQTWLESTLQSPQWHYPPYHLFGTTYQYFSSLAYLASHFDSPRLRKIVVHFWTHHGSTIASREREPQALYDWSLAISKSIRNQEDLIECFRIIVMSRPDFGMQMSRIARRNPTASTQMICHGLNQIIERIEESELPLGRQGRNNYFRREAGSRMLGVPPSRRTAVSPYGGGRARRPGIGWTLSGTLAPRYVGGAPLKTVVKMEKRRVDFLEDRLERLEGGVKELAEETVLRNTKGMRNWRKGDYDLDDDDVWDEDSHWSELSDLEDDDDDDSWM
ncbi:putative proteasome subunit alpha type-1 [Venturia nashicola]|nr:putative proteasome subunit alpha type-1 [Venturia nashicola]